MSFKIKLEKDAYPLIKAHPTDAGYDIKTPISFSINPKSAAVINTGVHVQIPHEYAGLIVSKSGLNVNYSIKSTGLIDEGYTGPIIVKLYNESNEPYYFNRGDKITQLVLIKTNYLDVEVVDEFEEDTKRGDKGFGSSGK